MEKTAVKVRPYLIVSSILALAASAAGCGGSPGGERPGNGGAIASGGTISSGGTTGIPTQTGGVTVTGGTTSTGGTTTTSTVLACTPGIPVATPLVTDFSTGTSGWHATVGKWGLAGNLTGSIFSYGGDSTKTSTMNASVDTTAMNLVLSGNVVAGDYSGGGMSFDQCVNTSTYTGVQFTLGGTAAGCDVYLQIQTYSQQSTANKGGCVTSCYGFPKAKLLSTSGSVTVRFADMVGTGLPAAAEDIKKEMVGLQWQFQSGAPVGDGAQLGCTGIALTVDDVSFVSN